MCGAALRQLRDVKDVAIMVWRPTGKLSYVNSSQVRSLCTCVRVFACVLACLCVDVLACVAIVRAGVFAVWTCWRACAALVGPDDENNSTSADQAVMSTHCISFAPI